jgi:hypothetical protein
MNSKDSRPCVSCSDYCCFVVLVGSTTQIPEHFLAICHGQEIVRRVRKIAKSDYYLRHISPSAGNNSAVTGRIFMKFYI